MSTISSIEDAMISTVKALNVFKVVESFGRKRPPEALQYPAAFVYFVSEKDTGARPRPTEELIYEILVVIKNLQIESAAAKDAYELLDDVRNAINFKSLGLTDVEPFTCVSRAMTEYADGIMSYTLQFKTRHYLPLP